jgi:uncharacterized protein YggT (Ycf19 family)
MVSPMPNPDNIDRREATVTHAAGTLPIGGVDGGAEAQPTPASAPSSAETERVTIDYAAERYASLVRASRLISFMFGVIVTLIGIRVLLKFMAANPASPFAQFIYGLTGMFVAPFNGLTASPAIDGSVLELSSLVAVVIYALVGWALVKLLWVLFYRPSTRSVSTRTYHHS